jgi:hypothetical protein
MPDAPTEHARELLREHRSRRARLDLIRRYWKALQPLPAVIPQAAPREVREMARISRVNMIDIVVGSLTQSLFVDGFRVGNDADNVDGLWDVWQANRMDRWQAGLHRAAVAYGASYMVVAPSRQNASIPVMRGKSPRKLTAFYPDDPDWPSWAIEETGRDSFVMYDADAIYRFGVNNDGPVLVEESPHPAGVTPVVRYMDEVDLDLSDEVAPAYGTDEGMVAGQVAPLMKLQDQIDMTTFGLLVAQHYSAFRQRYAIGWVAESETQHMKAAASQLWTFDENPDDMTLGEFSQTQLDGYIRSREASLRHGATLSQTPVHELIGELVNLSAEALAAAEAGRDRKVDERKSGLGESHEQAFWLAGQILDVDVPDGAQVVWRDTSARSFAATVDGLGKLVQMLGIPPQELWEKIPGATQQDVERWKSRAAEGDSMAFLADMINRQAEPEAA